jgi:hypothetical protein
MSSGDEAADDSAGPGTPPTSHRNALKHPKSSSPLTPVHGESAMLLCVSTVVVCGGVGWCVCKGGGGGRAYQAVCCSSYVPRQQALHAPHRPPQCTQGAKEQQPTDPSAR